MSLYVCIVFIPFLCCLSLDVDDSNPKFGWSEVSQGVSSRIKKLGRAGHGCVTVVRLDDDEA